MGFLILLTACALAAEIHFYTELKSMQGQSGFYYKENILTREQAEGFWENASDDAKREIRDITLFGEKNGKVLRNEDLGRDTKVKLVEMAGNMNLITPGRLAAGAFVTDSDRKGCVISKKTADTLFGAYEVTGEQVSMGKDSYIIRGIVDTDGQLCMIQGKAGRQYNCIRVEAPGIPLSVVRQRLSGILIEGKGRISECDLYLGIGRILLYLPLWILLYLALSWLRRRIPLMLHFILPVAGFSGVCGILLLSLHFSDDYVPSAWSDFAFWTQLFAGKKEDFLKLLNDSLYYADSLMLGCMAGILVMTVILCALPAGCRVWTIWIKNTSRMSCLDNLDKECRPEEKR